MSQSDCRVAVRVLAMVLQVMSLLALGRGAKIIFEGSRVYGWSLVVYSGVVLLAVILMRQYPKPGTVVAWGDLPTGAYRCVTRSGKFAVVRHVEGDRYIGVELPRHDYDLPHEFDID